MLIRISERRHKILLFVEEYLKSNGYPPTIREIGKAVGISSTSVVSYNMDRLIEAGLIKKVEGGIRGISDPKQTQSGFVPAQGMLSTELAEYRQKGRRPKKKIDSSDALEYFGGCAYCGSQNVLMQRDHFIPVSIGGMESVNNLLPACGSCNRSKSDKDPVIWTISHYGVETLSKIIYYLCSVTSTDSHSSDDLS